MRPATLVAVLLAAMVACHAPFEPSNAPSAVLGQPTKIGVGQAASFDGGRFELGLHEVLEDSRCPADVLCIQMGSARLRSWVRTSAGRRDAQLRTDARPPATFDDYVVEIVALEPYPYSNIRIDPRQYVTTVVVSRR